MNPTEAIKQLIKIVGSLRTTYESKCNDTSGYGQFLKSHFTRNQGIWQKNVSTTFCVITSKHKKFPLDGRLVGDLGDVIVQDNYDVELFDKIVPKYDGVDSTNRNVQIKVISNVLKIRSFPNEPSEVFLQKCSC